MTAQNPYTIIKSRYITEKASVLNNLQHATSNKSVARCEEPKYVFLVDKKANKIQIAKAIEEIYAAKEVKVVSVNTINMKPKARRVRGHQGFKSGFKKAIVTLRKGNVIDDQV
jgi:large subunit ribosomal protein L23